ncbi:ATP-binding protein [Sphingomonas sp. ASV193]|uniref:sensor histidine kinase n=1 Tax=Sphingomonas sp. ASV193 TaxID=3144405 RepID=UPI0032E871FB
MIGQPGLAAAIVVVAALWAAIAAGLSILAVRRLRRAGLVIDAARDFRRLLASAPARPVVLLPDGSIECDRQLARDLGLDSVPTQLSGLGEGDHALDPADLAAMEAALAGAALGGKTVRFQLGIKGSERAMEVRAAPAAPPAAPGTMLLWLLDVSTAETERAALSRRLDQTESALDALTHLIEAAPFPMWYRGPDLSLGLVNSAFVTAVQARDAAEVIARGNELLDAGGGDSAKAGAIKALEQGRPYSRTQPATLGEERRMLRLVDVPLPTGAVAGFAIDIQALEDARHELSRHVQSQRELADRMTAGAVQFNPDRQLDFYNQPFAVMARLEPEWLDEQPEFDRLIDRMREQGRLPEVRDFPAWKQDRRGWFMSPEEMIEEDWILANGDHWRVVAQPLPDGGLRLILEDRTEQVRLASARDTLLRVRAATFDNLFEAVSVFASDGRLYLWNRRFSEVWNLDESWLGEHPRVDELVPVMARQLVNPTAAAQVRELVRSTTTGRQSGTGRVIMTDGRQLDFAAVPLPDGNALFTMVDVTDSSRIEAALRERTAALEEADRVKTGFVANMSYELRTPLTSIGGFAEMLANGYAGPLAPAASDYVGAILEAVSRLSKMIDDVLDLTQGGDRAVTLERERIDMGGLVRTTVDTLRPRAEEKRQSLKVDIDPSAGTVIGDVRRLRESIEHPLRNAIAFTDARGKIAISASGDEAAVTIVIADNGRGIAAEDQERVFERFHRVGDSTGGRGADAALGLGLPLTRQFVEAHGGSVRLESEQGKGTRLTLVIPRAPQ